MNTLTIHPYIQKSSPQQTASRVSERSLNERVNESEKNYVTKTANKHGIKREPAEINFCGLFRPEKMEKFYQSPKLHSVLKFAKEKQIVFSAAFVLFLTCILRPAAIILSPSKKNKDDQKYASAHSIASGVIGFALSSIILDPLTKGIEKFNKNPENFIKNKKNFLLNKDKKMAEATKLANSTSGIYLGRLTDILPAIPKGILTIALIPPILKYVFGIEKKKGGANNNKSNNVDYSLLNFKSNENKNKVLNNALGGTK